MSASSVAAPVVRCARHPGRPAADHCPVCGRGRCAADAVSNGTAGCIVCLTQTARAGAPRSRLERAVAGVLAAYAVALLGAPVISQYIGSAWFELLVPAIVGVAAGLAATAAARTGATGRLDWELRLAAGVLVVLAVALAHQLVPGGTSPITPISDTLPRYAGALIGALGSRLLR